MNIFITGGSNGIGKCLYQSLVSSHEISAPTRAQLDLSEYPSVPLESYDAVILCAGSDLGGKNLFVDMEDQHWQNTMQVNLLSNIKLIKDYIKSRRDQWSKIVVIGSTATDHIWPTMLLYTISKIALENFCRGLRQEISKNIGIAIVRPGLVKTNFNMSRHMGNISQEMSDQWYDSQAHLMPEDLVPVIENILSDRAHSIREITVSL